MTKMAGTESGSISQRHGFADPDPHQNAMDPQHWKQVSVGIIANFRVELFPRSVWTSFLPICQDPESAKIGSTWVLSKVSNELDFNIVIIASFEPNLNFIWLLYRLHTAVLNRPLSNAATKEV